MEEEQSLDIMEILPSLHLELFIQVLMFHCILLTGDGM